jgi:hypothetical protein
MASELILFVDLAHDTVNMTRRRTEDLASWFLVSLVENQKLEDS